MIHPWGYLKSETFGYEDILLFDSITFLGRNYQKCFSNNSYISGTHFQIQRKIIDGFSIITARDVSSNGSYVNGELFDEIQLHCYDEISLFHPQKENSIHYCFIENKVEEDDKQNGGPQYDYEIGNYLGSGGFSIVRDAFSRESHKLYAIKIIKNSSVKRTTMFQNEINIMQLLEHPNIIKLEKVYITNEHIFLIMERLNGGDLYERIINNTFSQEHSKVVIYQILSALKYIKAHNIIHRDIKPENILFVNKLDYFIKITDFGLSRRIDTTSHLASTVCGSDLFIAPEILKKLYNGTPYDGSKVDVWSSGVLLFVMVCGYPPFSRINNQYTESILKGEIIFKEDWNNRDPILIDLIKRMLVVDVNQRINIENCLLHPFFK
ncbi:calcium-dependent protein kinase, putative [Entamoeba dispar SAW760]|uniref:non-specific serine/threonine protein kinase n=1 Tax=Entamoeba dispar (strain ATCC PRA-260 / SAW760) TaxID=370354 RepID=B0EMT5_ENTDS|nr:calcium-dependent protein kinase, putative [Entamoeba dispar SAW760]EDR24160.1 calcium-dependent protein kinase, putative [Entamoeba dispar SAW760]|eukprot:EDR24160.1 calcium-dependent protein kinase, putative [Entamoeba dispar SAW760]